MTRKGPNIIFTTHSLRSFEALRSQRMNPPEADKRVVSIEAISKPSIRFKIKADRGRQPQKLGTRSERVGSEHSEEIVSYFEDWIPRSNAEIGPEGRF